MGGNLPRRQENNSWLSGRRTICDAERTENGREDTGMKKISHGMMLISAILEACLMLLCGTAAAAYLRDITVDQDACGDLGTVAADKENALAGETVTVTVNKTEEQADLLRVSYFDDEEHVIEPDETGAYIFEMPDNDVTVRAFIGRWLPHEDTVYRPVGKASGFPDSKNWYLYEDMETEETWTLTTETNLFLNGHSLTKTGSDGPLISIMGGSLYLTDKKDGGGTLRNGHTQGGCVLIQNGSFIMTAGTITDFHNPSYGGGVAVLDGGFLMTGGKITGCDAAPSGGGVAVNSGCSFRMSGGEISGNTANAHGAGVYVFGGGELILNGGTISNNSCSSDGAGVYITKGARMELSEAPSVTGNKAGSSDSNVFLGEGVEITIGDSLTNTAPIGITTEAVPTAHTPVVFTSGLAHKATAAKFRSDSSKYKAVLNANHECMLAVPLHVALPAGSGQGTVRITAVSGIPVAEPPEYVLNGDAVTLDVTPARGYAPAAGGLKVTWTDESNAVHTVGLEQGAADSASEWTFIMPPHDVRVTAAFTAGLERPDFTMPASLTEIKESAFDGAAGMTAVDASRCTRIGKWAFRGAGLLHISLPKDCTIDPDAFEGRKKVYVFAEAGGTTEAYCEDPSHHCELVGGEHQGQ